MFDLLLEDVELIDLTVEDDIEQIPAQQESHQRDKTKTSPDSGSSNDFKDTSPRRPSLFQKRLQDCVLLDSSCRGNFTNASPLPITPTYKASAKHSLLTPPSSESFLDRRTVKRTISDSSFEDAIEERPSHKTSPTPTKRLNTQTRPLKFDVYSKLQRLGPVPDYCFKKDVDPPTPKTNHSHIESRQRPQRAKTCGPIEITRLGYRGFSERSQGINTPDGFRAGAFAGMATPPACPGTKDPVYVSEALRHVGFTKEWPTPFISLIKNPIRAIARAFQLGRKNRGFLAIIDMDILEKRTNVQAAGNLGLNPPNVHYDAGGEFLVWGFIPKEAVLSIINVGELYRPFTSTDEDVLGMKVIQTSWRGYFIRQALYRKRYQYHHDLGIAIGAFVRAWKIPQSHFEAAVDDVSRDWIGKRRGIERWNLVEEFATGVKEGYENGQPDEKRPVTPPPSSPKSPIPSPQSNKKRPRLHKNVDPATILPQSSFHLVSTPSLFSNIDRSKLDSTIEPASIPPQSSFPPSLTLSADVSNFSSLPFFYEGEMKCFEARLEDPFVNLPSFYEKQM